MPPTEAFRTRAGLSPIGSWGPLGFTYTCREASAMGLLLTAVLEG